MKIAEHGIREHFCKTKHTCDEPRFHQGSDGRVCVTLRERRKVKLLFGYKTTIKFHIFGTDGYEDRAEHSSDSESVAIGIATGLAKAKIKARYGIDAASL